MTQSKNRFPSQIKYIVGNEAAERFSYYGMRAILVVFMIEVLGKPENQAKAIYHYFIQAAYFTPLLGAYLSDRFWGKYKTILWLSLVYCLGHLVLALFESEIGLYTGLGLIALGAGGIKPCVSANVGDQFTKENQHLIDKVFGIFYFSVNFGAMFSMLLIPYLLAHFGPRVAFGLPGILMALATLIFWMGRKRYVHVPPTGKNGPKGLGTVLFYAFKNGRKRKKGVSFLDGARPDCSASEIEGVKSALDVGKVFLTVLVFWALFDQQGSAWTLQARQMDLHAFGVDWEASQIQALNSVFVLTLIPIFSWWWYPKMKEWGYELTPLRKMSIGMVLTGFSFLVSGLYQLKLDQGVKLSVAYQILPYFIISASEVLISVTALEFAYTQAPRSAKSTLMSLWLLTISFGNLLAAVVAQVNYFKGAGEHFFYAILMGIVSVIFIWTASRYKVRNYVEN